MVEREGAQAALALGEVADEDAAVLKLEVVVVVAGPGLRHWASQATVGRLADDGLDDEGPLAVRGLGEAKAEIDSEGLHVGASSWAPGGPTLWTWFAGAFPRKAGDSLANRVVGTAAAG